MPFLTFAATNFKTYLPNPAYPFRLCHLNSRSVDSPSLYPRILCMDSNFQTKIPTPADQWTCTKYVLLQHFTVELPQIYIFHLIVQNFGLLIDIPFPEWHTMAWQIAIFFVMEDTFHYWAHRL